MRRHPSRRLRDVIDINRTWIVFVGSRRTGGYSIGSILAAGEKLALAAARAKWPTVRIGFVDELTA